MAIDPFPVDEVAVGDADFAAHRVEAEGGDDRVVSRQARETDLVVDGGQVGIGGVDLPANSMVINNVQFQYGSSKLHGRKALRSAPPWQSFSISALKQLGKVNRSANRGWEVRISGL